MSTTTHYNLPTLQSTQGDIGDCLEDLLVEDNGNSGMEIIDETLYNHDQNINTLKGVVETFSVSSWTADNAIAPFTYKATVTLVTTLSAQSIVELLNDDAVLFATYGFSIGDITNQVVTIYSIGQPSATISISIRIGGVLSSGGGSGSSVTASDIDSETATAGQVLQADGTGGASWGTPSGGTTLNKYTYSGTAFSRVYRILNQAKGAILGILSLTINSQALDMQASWFAGAESFCSGCTIAAASGQDGATYIFRILWSSSGINSTWSKATRIATDGTVTTDLSVSFRQADLKYYNDTEIT